MTHARRLAIAATVFGFCLASAASARAESCHLGLTPEAGPGLAVWTRFEAARYDNRRYSGRYEGIHLGASFMGEAAGVTAILPGYHLVRNGLVSQGLGDLTIEGRALPWRGPISLGALLAVSLPTGDAKDQLGMGHVMAALGALVAAELDFVRVEAILGLGQALTADSSAHAHHSSGLSPLVAPMNPSELEGSLTAVARPSRRVSTRLGVFAAESLRANGAARGTLAFGVNLHHEQLRLGLEGALPLIGDAFRAKTALEFGVQF